MAQKIAAAADHGINAFIFDWYYYDDGLFLERVDGRQLPGARHRQRNQVLRRSRRSIWPMMIPVPHTPREESAAPGV